MFHIGQKIGHYTLIRKLGRGGFGEVWLAENRTKFATTEVAVKLPLDEQIDHALVEQEAQLWAKASGHPNVLPIIEANEYDGQIVIVSEYSPDGSLEQSLKQNGGKLLVEQAVEMTIGILKGLEFLHSKKIIHRDLKPDNILLQGDTPRLADFGISRVIKTSLHATQAIGTPYYMSPEAFDRVRTVQTDVWSTGVMLYQMLKGDLPFSGDTWGELLFAITQKEPEPLPNDIPLALQKIVTKSLAKAPTERYQSAEEMRRELNNFRLNEPLPTVSLKPKVKLLYFAIAAVGLFLFVVIFGKYWMNEKPEAANTNTMPLPSPTSSTFQNTSFNEEKILQIDYYREIPEIRTVKDLVEFIEVRCDKCPNNRKKIIDSIRNINKSIFDNGRKGLDFSDDEILNLDLSKIRGIVVFEIYDCCDLFSIDREHFRINERFLHKYGIR